MTCTTLRPALVAYYFGEIDPDERGRVESHLAQCPRCIGEYIALKREIELEPEGPRPSERARARLRDAIERELGAAGARTGVRGRGSTDVAPGAELLEGRWTGQPWLWWQRPLAFGVASAAVVLAIVATRAMVDTSGSMPLSLQSGAETSAF